PHLFAEARLDVVAGVDGRVEALRHLWRFDEIFSSQLILDFDADGDLKLGFEELEKIAGIVHESLAEFDYFQFVTVDGSNVAMQPPERLIADFQEGQF